MQAGVSVTEIADSHGRAWTNVIIDLLLEQPVAPE